jgi:hypothetical protein
MLNALGSLGRMGAMMPLLWLLLIGFVFYALTRSDVQNSVRNFLSGSSQDAQRDDQRDGARPGYESSNQWDDELAAKRKGLSPRAVADKAVRRAGNELDTWLLDLDDIGLLAYNGDKTPDLCRVDAIPSDTTHLRPFIVINLPYKQGKGALRFELLDETGEKRYDVQKSYQLKGGPNFITTPTWLPLDENHKGGKWSLRVSIGDKPLAVHEFTMKAAYGGQIRSFLHEDGEIDPWLSKAITEQDKGGGDMSLDDLLAAQEDAGDLETENRLH